MYVNTSLAPLFFGGLGRGVETRTRFAIRALAAAALGEIGGQAAKEALEAVLDTEDNETVLKMMKRR